LSPIDAHVLKKTAPLIGQISLAELATDRPMVSGQGGDGEGMVREHGGDPTFDQILPEVLYPYTYNKLFGENTKANYRASRASY